MKNFYFDERAVLDLVEVHQGEEKFFPISFGVDALAEDHPDPDIAIQNS